jgi:hypothetical protein
MILPPECSNADGGHFDEEDAKHENRFLIKKYCILMFL